MKLLGYNSDAKTVKGLDNGWITFILYLAPSTPSKDRWKIRSTTFEGIAKAMANQWGKYVLNEKIEF